MSFIYRYLSLHYKNLVDALTRITEQPLGNLMTIVVIGIALALPAGLRVMVSNISTMSDSWDAAADFTIYLEMTVDETRANELARNIEQRTDVRRAILIDRAQALVEFQNYSGFGEALETLQVNPLPHALIISPTGGSTSDVSELAMALEGMEETALVQLDTAWVKRLRSILELALRVVDIVTVLLGFGVIIVIGNTIRLEINNRQDEIEVIKLVGGSNGYVRRPFLYSGFWYGFGGGIVAILTIWGVLGLVNSPARALAELYDSSYRLIGLNFMETLMLLGTGGLLGWAGAAIATARHLRDAEQRLCARAAADQRGVGRGLLAARLPRRALPACHTQPDRLPPPRDWPRPRGRRPRARRRPARRRARRRARLALADASQALRVRRCPRGPRTEISSRV